MSSTPIVLVAAVLLTPLIMRSLARAFPARVSSTLDYKSLRFRHAQTELWSRIIGAGGMIIGLCFALQIRRNSPWLVGALFGWLIVPAVLFIGLRTLPKGLFCWREFWRFYEVHYHIDLRLLALVYVLLGVVGIVSIVALLIG